MNRQLLILDIIRLEEKRVKMGYQERICEKKAEKFHVEMLKFSLEGFLFCLIYAYFSR